MENLTINNWKPIRVGDSILVQWKAAPEAKSLALNLGKDASNLLICFKPDFTKGSVTCKDKINGEWGPEGTFYSTSFPPNVEVTVNFNLTKEDTVSVTMPDGFTFEFRSRLNLGCVQYISTEGDFEAKSIETE